MLEEEIADFQKPYKQEITYFRKVKLKIFTIHQIIIHFLIKFFWKTSISNLLSNKTQKDFVRAKGQSTCVVNLGVTMTSHRCASNSSGIPLQVKKIPLFFQTQGQFWGPIITFWTGTMNTCEKHGTLCMPKPTPNTHALNAFENGHTHFLISH